MNTTENISLLKWWDYVLFIILAISFGFGGGQKPEVLLFYLIAIIWHLIARRKVIKNTWYTKTGKIKILIYGAIGTICFLMFPISILLYLYT